MTTDPANLSPTTPKDYYTTLYQAALSISSSIEVEQVLQSIVKSIAEAMDVKGSLLRLLDSKTNQLHITASYGMSGDYLHKGPVDVNDSPIDRETLCDSFTYIPDVRTDPRFQYQEAAKREGIVSLLCVPLDVHGTAIGVLRVYTDELRTFTDEDVKFLSILASLAAQAIENARLFDEIKKSYSGVVGAFWGVEQVDVLY
ncbi:MAG: GAF domain-containing protein [Ktedonobacteraceae bacterium]|nr:GAF domain-containing protein [Ktedonobacteraceae bacterium]